MDTLLVQHEFHVNDKLGFNLEYLCKKRNSVFLKCERKYLLSCDLRENSKILFKIFNSLHDFHQQFKGFKFCEICHHFNFQREG